MNGNKKKLLSRFTRYWCSRLYLSRSGRWWWTKSGVGWLLLFEKSGNVAPFLSSPSLHSCWTTSCSVFRAALLAGFRLTPCHQGHHTRSLVTVPSPFNTVWVSVDTFSIMTSPLRYIVGIDELNFFKNLIENIKTESSFTSIILGRRKFLSLWEESIYNKEMRDIMYWVDRNDRIEDPSIKNFTSQYCRVQYFLCQDQ